jgi:hypothetical protein
VPLFGSGAFVLTAIGALHRIPIPPQGVGRRFMRISGEIAPLDNGMHEITETSVVATPRLWRFAPGAQPIERKMHHELMESGLGRGAPFVIAGTGAAHLTHD